MAQRRWKIIGALLFVLAPTLTRADTIHIIGAAGKQAVIADVQISGIADGRIAFKENQTGRQAQRELSQVLRIALDDEPNLDRAESAYAQRDWTTAAAAYREVIHATRRPWVRFWVAPRLIECAENTRGIAATVAGYVALVQTNPPRAETYTPTVPEASTDALATAVQEVSSALSEPTLTPQQRACLNSFLLDIHRVRKDAASADALLNEMLKSGDAGAARAVVRKKLDAVSTSIERKEFQAAIDQINEVRHIFIEQRDQAEALYYLAEAASGLALSAPAAESTVWKDVALAYMRVVAHFKDAPGTPFVAPALLKAAAIEERRGNPSAAKKLYEQVQSEFTGTPAAASAQSNLARLRGK
jgi:hypothetical protein